MQHHRHHSPHPGRLSTMALWVGLLLQKGSAVRCLRREVPTQDLQVGPVSIAYAEPETPSPSPCPPFCAPHLALGAVRRAIIGPPPGGRPLSAPNAQQIRDIVPRP